MMVAAIEAINNPIEFSEAVNAANIVAMYNATSNMMPMTAKILLVFFILITCLFHICVRLEV